MERNLDRRFKANLVKLLILVADYPGMPAFEIFLECGADALVEEIDVFGTQSLSVGRIGHHNSLGSHLRPVGERFTFDLHHIVYPCVFHVLACNYHGLRADVAAIDLEGELSLRGIVVIYLLK